MTAKRYLKVSIGGEDFLAYCELDDAVMDGDYITHDVQLTFFQKDAARLEKAMAKDNISLHGITLSAPDHPAEWVPPAKLYDADNGHALIYKKLDVAYDGEQLRMTVEYVYANELLPQSPRRIEFRNPADFAEQIKAAGLREDNP